MQVIFLYYPGIEGEVLVEGHEGAISIDTIEMHSGGGESPLNRQNKGDQTNHHAPTGASHVPTAPPSQADMKSVGIDSITLHKSVDSATPSLLMELFRDLDDGGEEIEASIVVLRTHERQASSDSGQTAWHEPFLEISLGNARVSGHSLNVGKDNLTETITLGFSSMDITYTKYINGKRAGAIYKTIKLEE